MYNDKIDVSNKIITSKDLDDIFSLMNEEIKRCENKCSIETINNERLEREYQKWTLKDYEGTIKVTVDFNDDTSISFEKFNNFITIFNTRLEDIKYLYLRYSCSYSRSTSMGNCDFIIQHINIDIHQNKMSIDIKIDPDDEIMNNIYNLIKEKINNAPLKYDKIIENRRNICNKIEFSFGFIPSVIIFSFISFIPVILNIYSSSYVLFPIACIIFSLVIGTFTIGSKLDKLYKNLIPERVYVKYDYNNSRSIYKDDIDRYTKSSEILIGKNTHNLDKRNEIIKLDKKYSSYIKYELLILIIISVLVVLIGRTI